MARQAVPLLAFNRGMISRLALARTDIGRTALSAEEQTNWMPRVLGSMSLRPGGEYLYATKDNAQAYHIPFIFAKSDTAGIEVTDQVMRVMVDDEIITRPSVSTSVQNGDFSSATGWTDIDESGATSTINTTDNQLELVGTGFNTAGRRQQVTIAGADQGVEHALRIVVTRGKVTFRLGSTSGDDDLIAETTLGEGTHSLTFTPAGASVYVQFTSLLKSTQIVSSCTIEASGNMEIPVPWVQADLSKIRYTQSADVVYVACDGYQTRKIERRATRSWSVVLYQPEDGAFEVVNTTPTTITASDLSGDITLAASKNLFKSSDVGSLIRVGGIGQTVELTATGESQFSDAIRVVGVGNARAIYATITGTWSATITLQISYGVEGSWVDFKDYTTNATNDLSNDGQANSENYFRIGIKAGNYTSGTAEIVLTSSSGTILGVVRVTGYTDEQNVDAAVLKDLGSTGATDEFYFQTFSGRRGYPTTVKLHDGRLWLAGRQRIVGSVSDAFESFDDEVEGDSAPINRSIGEGAVDDVAFLLSLNRLILGTAGAEISARSSSLDEPLTVSNFSLKAPSTQGAALIDAIKIDDMGIFVQSGGSKIYQIDNTGDTVYGDYTAKDLTELIPEIGQPAFVRIAGQRQPDTRIHCVRSDGKVAILVNEPAEDVKAWILYETDGEVEDVFVLPGSVEDSVYYVVKRTINGSTVRYVEKWAMESECVGGSINKQADSFVVYDDTAATVISGFSHLEGETVEVWADGAYVGQKTVSSGQITLDEAASQVCAGLYYEARFKSAKLAFAASMGTALTKKKKVDHLGLILDQTHKDGILYGKNFDQSGGEYVNLDSLPAVVDGATVADDTIHDTYDTEPFEFPGEWNTDSRLCLLARAQRPCTVLAAIVEVNTNG